MSEAEREAGREALLKLFTGHMAPQVIHTATRLKVPEALAAGPLPLAEAAAGTRTHAPSLHRLLRALAFLGLVDEPEPGSFGLTATGRLLLPDAEGSLHATVRLNFREEAWRSWGGLEHSVTTGEPAFEHLYQAQAFAYFAAQPEVGTTFNRAMAEHTSGAARDIVRGYDFSRYGSLVDVGGNDGTLLSVVLPANPGLKGTLFDTPEGTARASEVLRAQGVEDRCEIVAGDFFESVPEGGDAYSLKAVIHDWDDERSIAILKSCRRAMRPDAKLLLIEQVMPDTANDPALTAPMVVSDLNMLVYTGGYERTERQFTELLAAAGFTLGHITAPLRPTDYRVLEANPA